MPVTAVVGLQWGDEAKGKFVDLLSPNADLVARFGGGDNAGHTVVNEFGTFKLRLMPNGFSNAKTICAIGPGVVVNPQTLIEEIETVQNSGIELESRLWVSPRCNLVMPYHRLLEGIYEEARGAAKTGTTRRGIGPVFADKVSYNGIRFFDLKHEDQFARKLKLQLALKNPILRAFGVEPLEFDALFSEVSSQYSRLKPYIREPFGLAQQMLAEGGEILLEGAQGALLDNNWGTYPFCTASITLAGGACAGFGIAPHAIRRVVGVTKAYTTRVGAGPMPTELFDETGEKLQQAGQEFGTVTGRARRCGWFDAELVRFTSQLNGATELALTKLDVLDELPALKICIGYRRAEGGDRLWHYWELDAEELALCEPVYLELEGWRQSTTAARNFAQLPAQAQAYVRKVEELVGVPVKFVSVGPGREATIVV
ncbi:MAG: adenylosuccinate synthase [Anaerolineae bacterium UTCFX2]|jgi:adenylosuccinate synthase|nr:adenylosuccinate synthase [Anaerolineae bacterium]MCZ7551848.1 adenylosuccinate synthase [Anaerolineales bacterium]OQY87484.1 MAG: adenylosuccinate synthase [Anaerolineae bacterium UTCFX2]